MPFHEISSRLRIHYLDENPSGSPAVLLLHGLGADGSSWALQTPALTRAGFRVLAADARGFGKSSYPGGQHTIADMAADMASLLDALQVAPADVIGISMGGTLALELALSYPSLVRRLVLVSTFAHLRPGRWRTRLYLAWRFVLLHLLGLPAQGKFVARRIFPRPDQEALRQQLYTQILQADPGGYRAAMRALARFNVEKRLGEIRHPTLVITGEADTTVPPETQSKLVAGIPNARQVVIPHAGHAVSVEQAEAFNQAALAFLAENDRF